MRGLRYVADNNREGARPVRGPLVLAGCVTAGAAIALVVLLLTASSAAVKFTASNGSSVLSSQTVTL
jgi:hypothetical protein